METRRPCAHHRSGLGGDGKPWHIGTEVHGDRDSLPRDVISRKLSEPNAGRICFDCAANTEAAFRPGRSPGNQCRATTIPFALGVCSPIRRMAGCEILRAPYSLR